MEVKKEQALRFLENNRHLHADMLDCIRLNKARILYAASDGALIEDETCGIFSLSASTSDDARKAMQALDVAELKQKSGWLVAHGEFARTAVYEVMPVSHETKCIQIVYPKRDVFLGNRLIFRAPNAEQLQMIQRDYDRESPENIRKIAKKGELFCAFSRGNGREDFVGFIGFHPEGSMGLLYIFPKFRRKGYAEETERFLIAKCLETGRTPYGHVVFGNDASMHLQEKLGFEQADAFVYWLR